MIEIDFAQLDFPGRDFFLGGSRANRSATVCHARMGYSRSSLHPGTAMEIPPILRFFTISGIILSKLRKYVALPMEGHGGPARGHELLAILFLAPINAWQEDEAYGKDSAGNQRLLAG